MNNLTRKQLKICDMETKNFAKTGRSVINGGNQTSWRSIPLPRRGGPGRIETSGNLSDSRSDVDERFQNLAIEWKPADIPDEIRLSKWTWPLSFSFGHPWAILLNARHSRNFVPFQFWNVFYMLLHVYCHLLFQLRAKAFPNDWPMVVFRWIRTEMMLIVLSHREIRKVTPVVNVFASQEVHPTQPDMAKHKLRHRFFGPYELWFNVRIMQNVGLRALQSHLLCRPINQCRDSNSSELRTSKWGASGDLM